MAVKWDAKGRGMWLPGKVIKIYPSNGQPDGTIERRSKALKDANVLVHYPVDDQTTAHKLDIARIRMAALLSSLRRLS